MKNRHVSLSLSVLHETLQTQVNESTKRVDLRRSENMMGNVYAQSSSIAKIDRDIAAVEQEIRDASADVLNQADQRASMAILFAYGEVTK